MGKKNKVILPPDLPPELADDEIQVSDEDINFVQDNKKFAGFLTKIDTKSIDKQVARVAGQKEDELEALYERRKRKLAALEKSKPDGGLQVDPVDALPIKTLDGELRYRTAKEWRSESTINKNESASGAENNERNDGVLRLNKAERRQKLKKSKKEAKKQVEEAKPDVAKGNLYSEVLAEVEEELSAAELFAKKKIKLAELGLALIEQPEANIKNLKELLQICDDKDYNLVKLALMSLLAVFKDIIPGYRIRLPTEKELQMTVSKEVLKTRFYESTLLSTYRGFLRRLKDLEKHPTFRHVTIRCMCNLLDAVPHFNFRDNLLTSVVRNISSSDDVVRKLCCEAVKSLFVNEGKHGGEATLDAVRLIADQVKIHDCQLHPDCIDVFLSLQFDEDLGKPDPVEEKRFKSKKEKRKERFEESKQFKGNDKKKSRQELIAKTREEVSVDLKSVMSNPDVEEQRRAQSETLAAIFEIYFRILKRSMDPSISRFKVNAASLSGGSGTHPLLASCLKGLGKFSHLIDLDFMGDLLGCLKRLAGHSDHFVGGSLQNPLSVSERLQCCIVAFRVMRNNLDALNVDLHEFFVQLYNLLLEYRPDRLLIKSDRGQLLVETNDRWDYPWNVTRQLCPSSPDHPIIYLDRGDVLAEALRTMLWEGRQHELQRSAAFIKRLATFSLCFGSAESLAALVTLKHLLLKNSKCRSLLENDGGGGSLSGLVAKYQPDASDPNLSGALASVLWELSLLSKHYNPTVSTMASNISSMVTLNPSQNPAYLSTTSPVQAFADLSLEKELSKPIRKLGSLNRKRKRGQREEFVIMSPDQVRCLGSSVDEDEVKSNLGDYFMVLKDIGKKEKLRADLNRTLSSISLYEEYKRQKKMAKVAKISTRKSKI